MNLLKRTGDIDTDESELSEAVMKLNPTQRIKKKEALSHARKSFHS